VLRNAQAREVSFDEVSAEDLDQLEHESEKNLVRMLPEFEPTVVAAARGREISRLTTYAMELAAAFHPFYHQGTILGEEPALTRARLALCEATRIVLANSMRLIGVEAPERM
jgi:arginyl-tRNA synthetase